MYHSFFALLSIFVVSIVLGLLWGVVVFVLGCLLFALLLVMFGVSVVVFCYTPFTTKDIVPL